MSNYKFYFPLFSETTHTILKLFSQHDLRKVGGDYSKKNRVLKCLAKIFGQFGSAPLSELQQ